MLHKLRGHGHMADKEVISLPLPSLTFLPHCQAVCIVFEDSVRCHWLQQSSSSSSMMGVAGHKVCVTFAPAYAV